MGPWPLCLKINPKGCCLMHHPGMGQAVSCFFFVYMRFVSCWTAEEINVFLMYAIAACSALGLVLATAHYALVFLQGWKPTKQ